MDDQQRRTTLSRRLIEAAKAHFEYEKTVLQGVYDQQWAGWYADFLIGHQWNELFRDHWTVPELAEALRQADIDYKANAPQTKWQDHYAARFAERA